MDSILNLFQKNSGLLANAAIVLLIIYMGWSLASAIIFFVKNAGGSNNSQDIIVPRNQDQNQASPYVDLSLLNLFGRADSVIPNDQPVDAPETRLNLQLKGVFKAAVNEESTAIIAERNKEGMLYRIGDSLPGKAILFDVFGDHILIKRGTAVEKLTFDDSAFRNKSTFDIRAGQTGNTDPRVAAVPLPQFQKLQGISNQMQNQRAFSTPSDIRSRIDEYKTRFESDPATVLSEFGLSPVEEGDASGYQVDSGPASAILKRSGLQEGDVILSVNGTPVGDSALDSVLIDNSMNAKRLRVEVKRGSRTFIVTVPVP